MVYVQWRQAGKLHHKTIRDGSELSIGRSRTAVIRLDNPHVSRDHALLRAAGETLHLQNVSKKNDIRVTEPGGASQILAPEETCILQAGSTFRLATIEFEILTRHPKHAARSDQAMFKITCPKCGRHIAPSEIFCPFDGTALANGQSIETPEQE